MSFNHYARKVRNEALPLGTRVSALRSCIRMLVALNGERFTHAVDRLNDRFSFNWTKNSVLDPPPPGNLLAALQEVESERAVLLKEIDDEMNKRKVEKIQRQSRPNRFT